MKQDVKKTQQALDYILRTNFECFLQMCFLYLNPGATYLPNWHIKAIAYQLDRIRRGEITRLIINMPPRYLKSLTVTVAFTAFLLGHEPWRKIFAISYGDDLSAKHASDFRSLVHAPWFKRAFRKLQILRSVDGELVTTKRGFRKSTSVSGPLTGLGGDLFYRRSTETGGCTIGASSQQPKPMGVQYTHVTARQQANRRDHRRHATRAHGRSLRFSIELP